MKNYIWLTAGALVICIHGKDNCPYLILKETFLMVQYQGEGVDRQQHLVMAEGGNQTK